MSRTFKLYIMAVTAMILCLLVLGFLFQGMRGIWQPDEGYYTGTAATMLNRSSYLIPYLGEEEIFLDKPPMIYWGIMAGLELFGWNEFGVRFFHGLCFVLTSIAVGALSWSVFKDKWLALLSCLVYSTMVVPFFAANFVTPDTILALWVAVSAFCFWKSASSSGKRRILWQMFLCTAVGLGFLSKGPAVLVPCSGMFIYLLVRKEVRDYFFTPWSLLGIVIFTATGLGWYIWVAVKVPGAYSYFIDNQVMGRLITEKYNRNPGLTGALIYVPVIVLGTLPWSVIWFEKKGFSRASFLRWSWWKGLPNRPEQLFLLCLFFVPLVILCAASSKLGLYALPLFVPAAIAAAKKWIQKAPGACDLSLSCLKQSYRRPARLAGTWIFLLLVCKLALAWYPTHNDMKALWAQVRQHMPEGNYELCTIDRRADGLIFYGANKVEHITNKTDPYPTFTKMEQMLEEMSEFTAEDEKGVLLAADEDKINKVIAMLHENGVECTVVRLPYKRALLFPQRDVN